MKLTNWMSFLKQKLINTQKKKEIRYIINWQEELDNYYVFYKTFEEADNKRKKLDSKVGKILKVVIDK